MRWNVDVHDGVKFALVCVRVRPRRARRSHAWIRRRWREGARLNNLLDEFDNQLSERETLTQIISARVCLMALANRCASVRNFPRRVK